MSKHGQIRTLTLVAFAILGSVEARGQIRITEYMYQGANGELVELTNFGASAVDMTGWTYDDNNITPPSFSLSALGTVAAGESVIITDGDAEAFRTAWGLGAGVKIIGGSGSVAALGRNDTINIWDASGTLMDRLQYGDDVFLPGSIRTQNRSGWVCAEGVGTNSIQKWILSAIADQQGSFASTGLDIGSPGINMSVPCPNAPMVESTVPARKSAVETLTSVDLTFSTEVIGVVAGNLTVNGSAATSLSGSGAGPYIFSGFAAPATGSVSISLAPGAIVSQLGAVPFAGDSWTVSVGVFVVINELNYHPSEILYPNQETEFLELYNPGASDIDLGGWSFGGFTYVIPSGTIINSGAFKVVAVNPAALQAATGYASALQWTSGALSNSGENISIRDASLNVIDSVTYGDSGEWATAPDGNGPSLELVNPGFPNEYGGAWRASVSWNGTPGAQNSTYQATLAPIITGTKHTPIIPTANQPVTVTATIVDDSPNPTITIYYREDQDPTIAYSSLAMLDDGGHGDGAAGDKVYGAILPGLADGQRLDFTIRAADEAHTSAAPIGNNTLVAGQYPNQTYLCKFSNAALPTDFPSYHLITTQRTRNLQDNHNENEYDATFVHCDTAGNCVNWYSAIEHYRGASSLYQHPHSFRLNIPDSPVFNSEMGFQTTKIALLSQAVFKQYLGMQFFRDAFGGSIPTPKSQFVRMNTNPLSHGGIQDFVYHNVEVLGDDNFIESQGGSILPLRFPDLCSGSLDPCTLGSDCEASESCVPTDDGNLYRGRYDGARLNYKGPDKDAYRTDAYGNNGYEKYTNEAEDNWDDLIALCYALDPATTPDSNYEASVNALIDEDEWTRWFAIQMLLVNREGGIYRDTGDDYFLYFARQTAPGGYNAKLLPWDMDSTFGGFEDTYLQETIWRTTTVSPQRFIRSNVYAGRFVKAICDMLNNEFTQANMDARIDALPTPVADATRKQTLKNWVAARRVFVKNEIKTQLTIANLPVSPYTSADPILNLNGQLNQCGTRFVKINGVDADAYSVYAATWSKNYTFRPGLNHITVQCLDNNNVELNRIDATVFYDPPLVLPGLRLTVPPKMVNTKTLTLKAELLDASGNIDWRVWNSLGTVSATRVSNGQAIPLTVTVFERHTAGAGAGGPPTSDSIRLYNGVGCVSFMLNDGATVPAGDILVTVTVGSATASKLVTVLDAATPGLFHDLSGTLSGGDLTWEPADGVIHLTGHVSVPSGQTLSILPGTLIMVDPGIDGAGTRISSTNSTILAHGTRAAPVYFFPTSGAAAMALPQTASEGSSSGHNNPSAWGGFELTGSGSMTWSYVFLTGAGNGEVSGHPRPPVIRLNGSYGFSATDSVMADAPGKVVFGEGSGVYNFQRCLFARNGIGGEFIGTGYALAIEDTWLTRIGRAPIDAENRLDGDILHIDQPSNSHLRRCIITDGGDDLIDHSGSATPVIENCILYDANDKSVSIGGGGSITMTNCLVFNAPNGIRCAGVPAYLTHVTLGTDTNVNGQDAVNSVIQRSILWPNSANTCASGDIDYTLVGNAADLGCGTGNLSINPMFQDANFSPPGDVAVDFGLQPGSPALTAGPDGSQIGWLGFPFAAGACLTNTDCDDGDPCTVDSCDSQLGCQHSAVSDGDMDANGRVDGLDIDDFVRAVVMGSTLVSDICPGDFDDDGMVEAGDVSGMVDALLNQ